MTRKQKNEMEKLVRDHYAWVEKFFDFVYKSALEHGFKHGVQSERRRQREIKGVPDD